MRQLLYNYKLLLSKWIWKPFQDDSMAQVLSKQS